ncbi:MAG: branched-chain amino acid transaminase [Gammaproteobacteria bacterium]|nr:branched-chain amino acid transaminase [Gammaproteobacteria bacterium]MCY4219406.1 branched-chain amino acid transaminase [Gammaproteobacteria bacterium]MCY4275176.1 branched-chain amino acid transaminase [Gammaproteobacteria bacterium]
MTKLAFFEGDFVPIEEAKISITTHTLHYGTGCFAGMRACWNESKQQMYLFRAQEHFQRMLNSARFLYCELPHSKGELESITIELLRREKFKENVYIRPIVYKDEGVFRVWLHDAKDKLAIFAIPAGGYLRNSEGISMCVSSWRRVDDTAIPARGKVNGSYVNSALAKSEAMLNGFDEAILLNQDGHVSEASAANFMIVRDGKLITPPTTANLLEGIVRRSILELATAELNIPIEEREIDRSELYIAEEAFFCGTGVGIASIGSIDHRTVGHGKRGEITAKLDDLYRKILIGEHDAYTHWLTPVYD